MKKATEEMKRRSRSILPVALTVALSVGCLHVSAAHRVDVRPGESLVAVRDRVRALPAEERAKGIEVVFPAGDYALDGSLELDGRDGGASEGLPVVWRAEQPGTVRLSSSRLIPISRFRKVTDPSILKRLPPENKGDTLVADVADILPEGELPSIEVFFDNNFSSCARWPNAGEYTSFTGRVDVGTKNAQRYFERGAFQYPNPRAKRWDFSKGVRLYGYWSHDWASGEAVSHFYGTENGTTDVIRLSTPISYGVNSGTWGRKERRFYALDLLEELDAPGEWWVDREHRRLYIVPPEGGLTDRTRICLAPHVKPAMVAKGLKNFTLEGFSFESHNGDVLHATGCRGLTLRGCTFTGIGGARVIDLEGMRCRISRCELRHIAAYGIYLRGGDRGKLIRARNLVEYCKIIDFGVRIRCYNGAMELEGCGHVVRHNEFAYAPHHAMRYETNDSIIEYNNIHHVLLETGDAGAIYSGCDCTTQGNTVRYNFIHELGAEGVDDSTMGLYFDDCDCGDEVYGNVFWKCSRGILIGGGRNHPIFGNVFADCKIGLSIDYRGHTWKQFYQGKSGDYAFQPDLMARMKVTEEPWKSRYPHLARQMEDSPEEPLHNPVVSNIFINCSSALVKLDGKEMDPVIPKMVFADNLVYGATGGQTAMPDERIKKGFILCGDEDPGFVNAANGDFRLKRDAPVLRKLPLFEARRFSWPMPWDAPPSVKGGIRGYSLDISRGKVPKMEKLYRIVDIIANLGYNAFTLYTEHAFAYSRHPIVWEETSPMTPEEVRALDDYCYTHGIELMPDQQSLGHMEHWLKHPEYNHLAEIPQGGNELDAWWEPGGKWVCRKPMCLCPTDPQSLEFVAGLFDELLPCFRSRCLNVHCDETHELYDTRRPRQGRSAAALDKKGPTQVYLDYITMINGLCEARGCTMRMAGDIVLGHPEVVPRLPKDVVLGIWHYEDDDYFVKNVPLVKATGLRYTLNSSTSCWCSLFGRTANMMGNVDGMCAAFEKEGAYGLWISDWGDGGTPQAWLSSVPPLVYFAHRVRGEKMSREQLAAAVDELLGCKVGEALLAYGDLYAKIGGSTCGNSELFQILEEGKDWKPNIGVSDASKFVTEESKAAMLSYGHAAEELFDLTGAPEWVRDDVEHIKLLFRAVEMRLKEPDKRNFRACFEPEYRRLWRKHNRVGGLSESLNVVFGKQF